MNLKSFKKLLAANRSEIAIRVFRATHELGIRTVAIYSHEDRFALHRFKADEAYPVGEGGGPLKAYLDIESIVALAVEKKIDAIHPGYGFLSENSDFARACEKAGIVFVGPRAELLDQLGDKTAARAIAQQAGVPVLPGSPKPVRTLRQAQQICRNFGYPVMLKAAHGGGGRGMRVVGAEKDLEARMIEARRESLSAFGSDEVFIEKLILRARHIEVQILGDRHGNLVHLYERDCSIQRRHQKVVEIAPALNLPAELRDSILEAAVSIGRATKFDNAGTVEFLVDQDTGEFYFIEVNPRIQVEHTVTEVVTGCDLVQKQILIAQGYPLHHEIIGLEDQSAVQIRGHAFQCRVTTEDPENGFVPDYGRLLHYRSASGMGIRLDAGTAFTGAIVTPYYDSLLVKVTAWGLRFNDAVQRMERCLQEFRVRGVKTNLPFLINLIGHPAFIEGRCHTRFIDETPELFQFPKRQDRATRMLRFIGEVAVNGNPLVKDLPANIVRRPAPVPPYAASAEPPPGMRDRLLKLGPEKFAQWILKQRPVLLTDTTFRDAHQSLLATRMRTDDMLRVAPAYAIHHADLFSLEMWGGATFDTSMRFLKECPWERLQRLRTAIPNIPFQMLLRASNAVGYTNYPDNVVRAFVKEAAASGIDVFRVFDSLNSTQNMRIAMDAVLESGAVCEAAICYTGDILNPARTKYSLEYYVTLAKELQRMGAHILAIKDMAGLCKPYAAHKLIRALKQETGLPLHFHTHDTSGGQVASLIKAAEAGVDIVDGAMAPLSGLTSQPSLNTTVEMLRFNRRETGMDPAALNRTAEYWEVVRQYYVPFEPLLKSGTAEVYMHEMPGGQYTNLYQQAASMGLESRWHEICRTYAAVNQLFGDIVKVTPSSKVVGDLALFMATSDLTPEDILKPGRHIAFPQSVIDFLQGHLGRPHAGFPPRLRRRILGDLKPLRGRPGSSLPPADFDLTRKNLESALARNVTHREVISSLLYPDVFKEFSEHRAQYGDVSVLPTHIFLYGLPPDTEVNIDIEPGKTLFVKLIAVTDADSEGASTVFFELNGQPRELKVPNRSAAASIEPRRRAEPGNALHIGAPMPGLIVSVSVESGTQAKPGDKLLTLAAMKMESTIYADREGIIEEVLVQPGDRVDGKDLLLVYVKEKI
ncbi:MAG: pyruvate carboxylase [Planctomycetota bacterium]|nr:pyruvate carboxylase [Planctomycetota bacterium]